MKVIIPDIEVMWEGDRVDADTVLGELYEWADEHAVMLYFDTPPAVPTGHGGDYEQMDSGPCQGLYARWPDESNW
jgi:hypothetical protein